MVSTSSGVIENSIPDFLALALARSQVVIAGLRILFSLEAVDIHFLHWFECMLKELRVSSFEQPEQILV